jgi:hypothetical protein
VNEKLFGVKATFDEDAYTTKLDRSAPDFKERERKAQRIANEIIGVRLLARYYSSCPSERLYARLERATLTSRRSAIKLSMTAASMRKTSA